MEKKGTPASPDTALARSVLPVPGEPINTTPLGMRAPSEMNFWGSLRNSTTSDSSCLASSTPATSSKVTVGFSPVNMRARLLPKDKAWLLLPCAWRIKKMKSTARKTKGRKLPRMASHSPHGLGGSTWISVCSSFSSVTPKASRFSGRSTPSSLRDIIVVSSSKVTSSSFSLTTIDLTLPSLTSWATWEIGISSSVLPIGKTPSIRAPAAIKMSRYTSAPRQFTFTSCLH